MFSVIGLLPKCLPLHNVTGYMATFHKVPENTPETIEPKKPKTKKDKRGKKDQKKSRKRASFAHKSKNVGSLKSRKTRHEDTCVDDRMDKEPSPSDSEPVVYKGYDISMLPKEAHPDQTKDNKGLHSYTLRSQAGDATIEVLLKHAAYYVKKVSARGSGPTGQVSMRVVGAYEAWDMAKSRAGFDAE